MFVPEQAEADLIARLVRLSPVAAAEFSPSPRSSEKPGGTIAQALDAVRSQAEEGRALALAAVRLAGGLPGAGPAVSGDLPVELHEAALAAEADGDEDLVRTLLLAGLAEDAGEADACLGFASLALRAGAFEDAARFCERCLALEARHPRACAILGFVRAREGRTEEAKTFLAAAARIARRDPRLRGDLDAAQRTLLLLQLAS